VNWNQGFIKWANDHDIWFTEFCRIADLLQEFLLKRIGRSPETAIQVAENFENVIARCDEITYEEPGAVLAYTAIHFLDRYHRSQMVFRKLIELDLLPTGGGKKTVDILDVGTGPGFALYALSDIYHRLKQFGEEQRLPELQNLKWHIEYVEKSYEFRNWLHHFTEHIDWHRSTTPRLVPFHTGAFTEFKGIKFEQNQSYKKDDGYYSITKKYRFDLEIFSNFLTKKEQVENFTQELENSFRCLRNRGLLLTMGAVSTNSSKYAEIYGELSGIIRHGICL
jgi:ribosomal protein RSM22 (predicted rRNA methylase)